MAINIYSGSSSGGKTKKNKSKVNKPSAMSSAASRAAQTVQALGGAQNAAASTSGDTAVSRGGTLQKVGKFVNGVSGLLSHVPGVVGTVASVVNKLTSTNDPEWWQTVPGDGVSTNDPLQLVTEGTKSSGEKMIALRPTFLEFQSARPTVFAGDGTTYTMVISPNDTMMTQYLMPQIRRVTNAVNLQDALSYRKVFMANASLYAMWQQLRKITYFVQHGNTFVANLNTATFPLFQNANAAWIASTITRLEEYLRANVRLPHTLCEYLAWRYGRTYKINASQKAAFVMYNVNLLNTSIADWDVNISALMGLVASTAELQKANADIYNAYYDHDQAVVVEDDTQCIYDPKEFALRTNLDIFNDNQVWDAIDENIILMDSNLDNPTSFMSSTISCKVKDRDGSDQCLFPVNYAYIYTYVGKTYKDKYFYYSDSSTALVQISADGWIRNTISPTLQVSVTAPTMLYASLCKAMEFYNVGIFVQGYFAASPTATKNLSFYQDITKLAQDSANVPDLIIANEQIIAFANLVTVNHKVKTSYKGIERQVAQHTADLVENLNIARVE